MQHLTSENDPLSESLKLKLVVMKTNLQDCTVWKGSEIRHAGLAWLTIYPGLMSRSSDMHLDQHRRCTQFNTADTKGSLKDFSTRRLSASSLQGATFHIANHKWRRACQTTVVFCTSWALPIYVFVNLHTDVPWQLKNHRLLPGKASQKLWSDWKRASRQMCD